MNPNIMACSRGIQGGRCSRCGTPHHSKRAGETGDKALREAANQAKASAIRERRRKERAKEVRYDHATQARLV